MARKYTLWLTAIGLSIPLVVFLSYIYGAIPYWRSPYKHWDLSAYQAVAAALPHMAVVQQPFGYRLLGPVLVRSLYWLSMPAAFHFLMMVAAVLSLALTNVFLRYRGISVLSATMATVLFSFNTGVFGFDIWDYFQIGDMLSFVTLLAGLYCLYESKWLGFSVVFLLGAITRETGMLLLPVALAYLWETGTLQAKLRWLAASVAPGLFVFVAIRLLWPLPGNTLLQAFAAYSSKAITWGYWQQLLLAYAPVTLLPLIWPIATTRFFKGRLHLAVLVMATAVSSLFGSDDVRLVAPMAIVVYWLIAFLLDQQVKQGLILWAVLGVSAATLALVPPFLIVIHGMSYSVLVPLGLMALVTINAAVTSSALRKMSCCSD